MLQLQNVTKQFGETPLLHEVSFTIKPHSRIGLVGRNGSGKSTLLKLIMGTLQPDAGTVVQPVTFRINYLSQEPSINPDLTLEEEMRSVFCELDALQELEASLIAQLENPDLDVDTSMALVEQLGAVQEQQERLDASTADARIGRILKGLGFSLEDYSRKTGDFSGGWQMRINLAKVLLDGADVILLDEPTNHLDLEACEWLENFLVEYTGGLVLVSHDRNFLDAVTTDIAELERGKLTLWSGNYSAYLRQKEEKYERDLAAYERQQKELAEQQAFVDKFRASANRGTQAKSREKQLKKVERLEAPTEDRRRIRMKFPVSTPSGREVLTLTQLEKAFEGKPPLFSNLDALLEKQQKVFLLGANGAGKTTLLRLLLGLEELDKGKVEEGYNVAIGYFSQNQLDTLDPEWTPVKTLQEAFPKLDMGEIRGLLGRFLFKGDDVFKPIKVLSGGEKSKVALAKLMLSGCNTLILDEPTNHMDIPSKDVITDALMDYEGTMLCISHDRYFIDSVATHIWELFEGRLITYEGDYQFYKRYRDERRAKVLEEKAKAARREARKNPPKEAQPSEAQASFLNRKDAQRDYRAVEKQLVALEQAIEALHQQLAVPAIQQDFEQLAQLSAQLQAKEQEKAQLNAQWENLAAVLA